MVKNTQGGSSHKKFARKNCSGGGNSGNNKNILRIIKEEGEVYAIVTKMLGSGLFYCHCIDGIVRLGYIRGKFSGKGRRDNTVEGGKWVLIGLREWDVPSDKDKTSIVLKTSTKLQKCDLLEVYSDSDKLRLRESVNVDWNTLDQEDVSRDVKDNLRITEEDIGFTFGPDRRQLYTEINSSTSKKITLNSGEEQEQTEKESAVDVEINFDDI